MLFLFASFSFFCLLFFVLLVGGHTLLAHALFRFDLGWNCLRWPEDLFTEECLVNDLVVGARATEVLVVHVAALGWINPDKVAAALVLSHRFANVLSVLQAKRSHHGLL